VRLLKREKYKGLFAKLNSGATNSVGGMSKRSDVPTLLPCVVSPKENKIKRNINNNLAVLLSHDIESKSA